MVRPNQIQEDPFGIRYLDLSGFLNCRIALQYFPALFATFKCLCNMLYLMMFTLITALSLGAALASRAALDSSIGAATGG